MNFSHRTRLTEGVSSPAKQGIHHPQTPLQTSILPLSLATRTDLCLVFSVAHMLELTKLKQICEMGPGTGEEEVNPFKLGESMSPGTNVQC